MELPEALASICVDFDWDNRKVWSLATPAELWPMRSLAWHLDLPFWSTRPPEPLFDLCPRVVLDTPALHPYHDARIDRAETQYPLEVMWSADRPVILDGLHRLARLHRLGAQIVQVRHHSRDLIPLIRR